MNGKFNGKGKEYYEDGKLKFEGEYLDDKKWNGKGYNINGDMEFEIKEGKGHVKDYFDNGDLEYEGEYSNGLRNGQGKEYFFGILLFEGEYLNGEKWNGKGKEIGFFSRKNTQVEYINGLKIKK